MAVSDRTQAEEFDDGELDDEDVEVLYPLPDDTEVDDDEWDEIVAEMLAAGVELDDLDDAYRAAGGDETVLRALGNQLKHYWTKGKGLKRWAGHPHPWTRLRNLLRKHVGPGRADRMASEWFHDVFGIWSGEREGRNPVGPG